MCVCSCVSHLFIAMVRNKVIFVVILISILLIKWTISEKQENNKLKDALKNNTSTKFNSQNNNQNNNQHDNDEDDNILKVEAKKMLKQCGVESNESQDMDGFGSSSNRNKNSFNKNAENNFSNRNLNSNYGKGNRQGGTGYDNNNSDGDWNAYGSQNWNDNNGPRDQGNRSDNTKRRSLNNKNDSMQQEYNEQSYADIQNHYRNGVRGNQYDGNSDRSQNNKYGFNGNSGSSSDRNLNNGNEYGGSYNQNEYGGSHNQNEYGDQSSNSRNGYDSQNSNNRNAYGGQNFGYGNSNYGQTTSRGGLSNNRGSQNEYGRNRHQNTDRGGYQSSNSNNRNTYFPYHSFDGGSDRNSGCDENSGSGLGYINGGSFGFNQGQHMSRSKRNNYFNKDKTNQEDDNQCISQCVFGYLQLLDNDRTPSETMVIKWLQEHVKGNDMDRVKALRDARRCFARLTTFDTDDSCDFSKELASCLELDLE